MEKYSKIKKYVHDKSTQGYEGYHDVLKNFAEYEPDQLDYIKAKAKLQINENKRLREFEGMITLGVSLIALLFSILPEGLKEDSVLLERNLDGFLLTTFIFIIIYVALHCITANAIAKGEKVLLIIEKVESKDMPKKEIREDALEKRIDAKTYFITVSEKQE